MIKNHTRFYIKRQLQKSLEGKTLVPLSNLLKPFFSGSGSIVMLHRVVENKENLVCDDLEVTIDFLEKIIQYFLNRNYEVITLDMVYEILEGKRKTERKFVAFTFDDGYVDNYSLAYPLFKKYQIPFAIYITTSFPDKHALLWWYALKELVNSRKQVNFNYGGKAYSFAASNTKQKEQSYKDIRQLVLNVEVNEHPLLFTELFEMNGIKLKNYVEALAMDWKQIKILAQDKLVTIGAHTTNHYNLKVMAPELVEKEIRDSKERIELLTNTKVEHFAFPFGSENEAGAREFEIAGKLGFKTSTTTRCGNIFLGHSAYIHCLPRITPNPYLMGSFPHYYASGFIPAIKHKFKRVITE
ncbi:polysaccharide deacetylase family protein [Planococcus glaciei]|uniref:polysaccharide deacetylase family protein n=1 Tax=Planococcus glaciei TaxID=459472 RepID=UPI001C72E707|nr:polysaccharide deacetylase family protein [Planococcus glaciei]MBX0313323.1 polysaccharide deacetylase family protein [Planococcus glaciei]